MSGDSSESGGHGGADSDDKPRTGAEEVLKEVREAELRLDDGERTGRDKEAADALRPSEPLQESVQKDRKERKSQSGDREK
ncbi:hypothetical protein [Streptomyces sp. NPDC058595]|uniref:hypothetical protein n=1 Tax=Streptomyces sp. NPDC058595 TaxID=3346550 RepID=UPI003659BD62